MPNFDYKISKLNLTLNDNYMNFKILRNKTLTFLTQIECVWTIWSGLKSKEQKIKRGCGRGNENGTKRYKTIH